MQTARGRATDFWTRYSEDIRLAAGLGCKLFRFSVAWSRVEPEPGRFDPDALDHYGKLVDEIVSNGMDPILTLHHFTWPIHVERRGGMTSSDFPDWFEQYAAYVANGIGDRVRWWITFNEPSQLVYGYIKPWWQADYMMPPGLPDTVDLDGQIEAVTNLINNLFVAHMRARDAIRSCNPQAQVGANPFLLGLPVWLQRLVDWIMTRVRSPEQLQRHGRRIARRPRVLIGRATFLNGLLRGATVLSTGLYGNWWHLGMAGRLPEFLCPVPCRGQQDFVGFDYYWGIRTFNLAGIGRLIDAAAGRFDRAPVWPGVLYGLLRYHQRLFPRLPILIVENGCVEQADGVGRALYLRRHLGEVRRAIANGVHVAAYVCWSVTSNREWGLSFGPSSDFGLYRVDLDADVSLARRPTVAAEAYRELIEEFHQPTQ